MAEFVEFLVNGVLLGALYALLALPMMLIWSTTDVVDINIGGYTVVAGVVAATVGGVVGVIVGIAAAVGMGAITGVIFLLFHRFWDMKDMMRIVLATFGLLLMTQSAVQALVGTENLYLGGAQGAADLAGIRLSSQGAINLAIAVVFLGALVGVLTHTSAGLRMRAAALSSSAAELVGIPVRRAQVMTFLVGAAMAGIVGILAAMTTGVAYSRGLQFTVFAFSAVILLGLRGPVTVFFGGLLLGVAEGLSVGYLPSGWSALLPPMLIVAVLAFGRFHRFSVKEVRA